MIDDDGVNVVVFENDIRKEKKLLSRERIECEIIILS